MKKKIILKRVFHHEKWRIMISFRYDEGLVSLVRQIKGNAFSATYKSWYADDTEETLKQILLVFRDKTDIDISDLTQKTEEVKLRSDTIKQDVSGSESTTKTVLPNFFPESQNDEAEMIPASRIIEKVVKRERFSPVEFRINEQDGRLAIRFTGHYDSAWIDEIRSFGRYFYDKATKEFLLPWSVLTVDSMSDYFSLRGVEVIVIKTAPTEELKSAIRTSGIKKDVDVHSLRHSYATHLHESGLDIRYIQELLGHRSTRTTEIYTHVSRRNLMIIRSPIEDMDVK